MSKNTETMAIKEAIKDTVDVIMCYLEFKKSKNKDRDGKIAVKIMAQKAKKNFGKRDR